MMSQKALLIIDLQNDYFPQGKFPLHNTAQILSNIEIAIDKADQQKIPIILIQHIADAAKGIAPFFNKGSLGVQIHPTILNAAGNADIVEKSYADSFEQTNLEQVLQKHKITELLITGMMTQNCVTHTAISKAAEKYDVAIVMDCCATVDQMIHNIALNAVSTRVNLQTTEQAFA
ncbi:MAG: nicotinamidase-related amidase [Psychromonas sp.]|jgi:nicotinamidase-related amidase|uniref:cysteine hydrolase family protein n=1 Tax=Psychromonas sp. TaxID=1884585 RepID=UPI0039E39EC4